MQYFFHLSHNLPSLPYLPWFLLPDKVHKDRPEREQDPATWISTCRKTIYLYDLNAILQDCANLFMALINTIFKVIV